MSYKITCKKFLSFIMAVLIASLMTTIHIGAVNVEENPKQIKNEKTNTVTPLWDNVNASNLTLSFLNKKICAKVRIVGESGTRFKNGTVTISKYSGGKYVPIKKWTDLSSSSSIFLFNNNELTATPGVKYKLSISITAYTSSKSEIVKTSKVATCP